MDPTQKDQIVELTKKYMDGVMEHAESVRVFVTFRYDGNTSSHTNGRGNYYAQYGHVKEWTIEEERSMQIDTDKRKAE